MNGLFLRQDTHSSSDVPARPTPTLVSSRSLRSSCSCWTAFGSCGVSSLWLWASLRRCSFDWPLKFMLLTTAPFCATVTRKGQRGSHRLDLVQRRYSSSVFVTDFQFQVCSGSEEDHSLLVPSPAETGWKRVLFKPAVWAQWARNLALSPSSVPAALERWEAKAIMFLSEAWAKHTAWPKKLKIKVFLYPTNCNDPRS